MARILCVGSAVLDLVFTVSRHPAEDEELRASALRVEAGGNAANSARVLRGLGHEVGLAAVLGAHPAGTPLEEGLQRAGVDLSACRRVAGMPALSAILLVEANGHRTIVHHRATPEYGPEEFSRLDLSGWDWVHFEARPGPGTPQMVLLARERAPAAALSLEVEKARPGIEACFPLVRVALCSRGYVQSRGFARPEAFLGAAAAADGPLLVAAWGSEGAWASEPGGTLLHAPAAVPAAVVDTIGAGDTFNAGVVAALAEGRSPQEALELACKLAGRKVGQRGLDGLAW